MKGSVHFKRILDSIHPRFGYWVGVVGIFGSFQTAVQGISLVTGILLIRVLSTDQYAYFTITNTVFGMSSLLADIGVGIALSSIGGRVWQDRARFGSLIQTALQLRFKMAKVVIVVSLPSLCWLLWKSGAPWYHILILGTVGTFGLVTQLNVGVYSTVPRLAGEVRRLQNTDLTGALVRLGLIASFFMFLNAAVAVAFAGIATAVQWFMYRRYAGDHCDLNAPANAGDKKEMVRLVGNQLPNTIFYCLQGQITIWLITIFGNSQGVAEVGALGRLAVIFGLVGAIISNVFVPRFARCHDTVLLRGMYFKITGFTFLTALGLLGLSALFPHQILWILGPKYMHLEPALVLMVAGTVLSFINNTVWTLNTSKAWTEYSWLYIPITLVSQAATLPLIDLGTVEGVLILGMVPQIPVIGMNFVLTWRGFKQLEKSGQPA